MQICAPLEYSLIKMATEHTAAGTVFAAGTTTDGELNARCPQGRNQKFILEEWVWWRFFPSLSFCFFPIPFCHFPPVFPALKWPLKLRKGIWGALFAPHMGDTTFAATRLVLVF